MLLPLLMRFQLLRHWSVISRTFSLNRLMAMRFQLLRHLGDILRLHPFQFTKLNPRNFRSCGFATALNALSTLAPLDSLTLSFSLEVMNRFTLSITRCPARSLRT